MTIKFHVIILFILYAKIFASPHIPTVVYPSKDRIRTSEGISKGKSTTKNIGSTLSNSTEKPQESKQLTQHQSGYAEQEVDNKSVNESRVVLAPIDGEKVYTLDRYRVTSSEQIAEVKHIANRPRTALGAAKTHIQLSRGISFVNELVVSPDLKRTTMSEILSTTTAMAPLKTTLALKPSSVTYTTGTVNSTLTTSKSSQKETQTNVSFKNVRLVSHDTSSASKSSSEIRYPAKTWQLPPTLFYARQKSHFKDLDTNEIRNSAAEEVESDASYEEALELFMKSQDKRHESKSVKVPLKLRQNSTYYQKHKLNQSSDQTALNSTQTIKKVAKSIDDIIKNTFGEGKVKPRPKMIYVNGDHKKFRATFPTHDAGDKEVIPLPTAIFPDESDMDLLVENTRRPGYSHSQITHSSIIPPHTALGPVPIRSVGQNAYVPLDPNAKLDLCCRKQQVSPVCQAMCNYDTFTDKSLISAVLSNQCPGPQLGQAFDCASSKADHSDCCTRNNLHLYANGQCMTFCRTHKPTPPNLISYIACLQVFDTVKNCYREYSYSKPNIFGD